VATRHTLWLFFHFTLFKYPGDEVTYAWSRRNDNRPAGVESLGGHDRLLSTQLNKERVHARKNSICGKKWRGAGAGTEPRAGRVGRPVSSPPSGRGLGSTNSNAHACLQAALAESVNAGVRGQQHTTTCAWLERAHQVSRLSSASGAWLCEESGRGQAPASSLKHGNDSWNTKR
jgi:hypothetical protein